MNKIINILSILFIAGCNSGHYNSVQVNGLEYGESYNALLFISPSVGLLGGYKSKETTPQWGGSPRKGWQFDAICWRTMDGGKNWEEQKIDDGVIDELRIKNDIIYMSISQSDTNVKSSTVIYTSSNQGRDWKMKCKLNSSLVRLHVIDTNWMIGESGGTLCETHDGGKTWNVLKTNYFVGVTFYDERHVYYFSFKDDHLFKRIVRRDLYTGEEIERLVPDGCQGSVGSGDLFFCRNKEELRVYKISKDFNFTYLYSFKRGAYIFAQYIGRYNDQVYLLIFSPCAGLFSLQHCFYYSPNGGKKWKRLGREGYISPMGKNVSTYGDSTGFRLYFYQNIYSIGVFDFHSTN